MHGVSARFDDALADRALVFAAPPLEVLVARRPDEVRDVLGRVTAAAERGAWAYGLLGYEAATAFEPRLPVHAGSGQPLAWFAIADPPRQEPAVRPGPGPAPYWTAPWTLDTTGEQHAAAVAHVRDRIAAGELYQANVTSRLHGHVAGDLLAYYADLVAAQRGAHHAYLELDRHTVLSASPELFFEWTRDGLRCRPMKGTAPRGRTPSEDARNRDGLARSGKDIAENVMIVDLLRNDLGRIAEPGSVAVSSLLDVERYESVWQLTSSITARPRADVTLVDVFAALFPCGSVTGAPKIAAAAAIADVEDTPRGFYCGAIGWVAPRGEGVRARFNVAIRTVTVDHDGSAVYGSGGGITIGSTAAAEFRELLDKTAVLSRVASEPLFLLETLRHDTSGFVHLHRHLARLQRTAAGFGFPLDEEMVRKSLDDAVAGHTGPLRVSLRLGAGGAVTVAATPYEASAVPVRVALDDRPVESASFWLRHKTSRRDVYESARARHPDADDVVLRNERGEITESTIANVGVRLDGRWYTPPVESGCLPGVGRAIALERGDLTERTISVDEFVAAERIALISSLRGWRTATI